MQGIVARLELIAFNGLDLSATQRNLWPILELLDKGRQKHGRPLAPGELGRYVSRDRVYGTRLN